MSQPPSDQDRPPEQDEDQPPSRPAGRKPSIWPSGNEPPAWPSAGQAPSWAPGSQAPSWPSGPSQDQREPSPPPAWPPADQPPLSSPDYTYGYRSRRPPRSGRRFPVRAVIMLALFVAFGFAVRGLTSHHQAASVASPPAGTGLRTGLQAPAGAVGATFSLNDGSGISYQVTLVKVIDPARGANQSGTPVGGKRFVGLVFRIKGLTGSPQGEDAITDAVLVGADGRQYPADPNRVAGYANFDDGAIHLTPGETATGAVAFQVPDGVAVSAVEWTALSGFGSMVEWNARG